MDDGRPNETTIDDSKAVAIYDYGQDAGAGFEGTQKSDFMVPMLDVLQANSKELVNNSLAEAKPGWLIVRALGMVFDGANGMPFVPVGRQKVFMRWRSRDAGGGIVATLDETDEMALAEKAKKPFGKIVLQNGDELVETYYLFGELLLPDEQTMRLAIPFTSTKIVSYRGLMTKANGILVSGPNSTKIIPPLFSHRYRLKTQMVSRAGKQWYLYGQINFDGKTALDARIDPRSALYDEARAFHQQLKTGTVKVDTAGAEEHGEDADTRSSGAEHAGQDADGENIPF